MASCPACLIHVGLGVGFHDEMLLPSPQSGRALCCALAGTETQTREQGEMKVLPCSVVLANEW